MKKLVSPFFLIFIVISLVAKPQEQQRVKVIRPQPYGSEGKEYTISRPGFVYSGEFRSAKEIDGRNFVLHGFEGGRHLICGRLKGGYWEARDDSCISSLQLLRSHPLPSANPNVQFFLVQFEYWGACVSSDSTNFAQVWKLSEGRLSIEQQIDYNTHFGGDGQFQKFSPQNKQLVVRASHYLAGDAHCCISAYDELTFRWSGNDYVLTRIETKRVPNVSERDSASKKN